MKDPQTRQDALLVIWLAGIYAIVALVGSYVIVAMIALRDKTIATETATLLIGASSTGGTALGILGSLLSKTDRPSANVIGGGDAARTPVPPSASSQPVQPDSPATPPQP